MNTCPIPKCGGRMRGTGSIRRCNRDDCGMVMPAPRPAGSLPAEPNITLRQLAEETAAEIDALPTDGRGLRYRGSGRDAYYVTRCHGVAVTVTEDVLCCKACGEEAEDFRMGMLPTVAETPESIAFDREMVRRALGN